MTETSIPSASERTAASLASRIAIPSGSSARNRTVSTGSPNGVFRPDNDRITANRGIEAEPVFDDALGIDFYDRCFDHRVVQQRARPGWIASLDALIARPIDHQIVPGSQPHRLPRRRPEIGDEMTDRRGIRIGHDRNSWHPHRLAGRKEHLHDVRSGILGRSGSWIDVRVERRSVVDLDDGAPAFAHRLRDVESDEIDARDIDPNDPGCRAQESDVRGVDVIGTVDVQCSVPPVATELEPDSLAFGGHIVERQPQPRQILHHLLIDRDFLIDIHRSRAPDGIGILDVDQLVDRVGAVANDPGVESAAAPSAHDR